jgi:hypothetical protein
MAIYEVAATVSSPPTNIWLTIGAHEITMCRDDTGCWAGKAKLDLTSPAAIRFRAVGISSSAWTLAIKFAPTTGSTPPKTYSHSDTIPDDELSDLTDQANLS